MVPTGNVLVAEVVRLLTERGESVATAESLTGGRVCAALTSVPGASAVVRGGLVAYTFEAKRDVLGVPPDVLGAHGTVAAETAQAMAGAALRLFGADWAVATTGVAGPDPSEGKDVGTVHVAVAGSGAVREERRGARALNLDGSREEIRGATVTHVLQLLRTALAGE